METRINEPESGCSSGKKESQERKLLYTCKNTNMVKSSMVYDPNETFSWESNFILINQTPFDEVTRETSLSSLEGSAKVSGLNHIRESLSAKGLSKKSCSAYIRSTAVSAYHEELDSASIGKKSKTEKTNDRNLRCKSSSKYLNDFHSNRILWLKELSQKLAIFSTLAAACRW